MRAEIKSARRLGSRGKRPICVQCGKVAYKAAGTAVRIAEDVSDRTGEDFQAYFNLDCGWHHIGHKRNGHPNRITREDLETMKVK